MKIQTTEGQVWWIASADELRPEKGIDTQVIAHGLQSIFRFQNPPVQKDGGGGVEFVNGRLGESEDQILVAKLVVFTDGVNIHVPTNTRDAELVLQEALEFFFKIGVRHPITPPLHFYHSTIVADFDKPLENILPSSLMRKISKTFPIEGSAQLLTFATNFDGPDIADRRWRSINPSLFKIERRASVAYGKNRYFCVANMETSDHIDALTELEKFAAKEAS